MKSRLVDCVTRGKVLDLAGADPVDEQVMRSWDESRTVPACLIRDILCGRCTAPPDPHGLRLRGARITGRLDLESLATTMPLELHGCFLPEGIVAYDARLFSVSLDGCLLEHPDQSPLAADRIRVTSVMRLAGATLRASTGSSAVSLTGAHIEGGLDCSGTKIWNESGPALYGDGLRVDQDVRFCDEFAAVGTGKSGAVGLPKAQIGGFLYCTGATIRNESGPALVADALQADQGLLWQRFEAIGAGDAGTIRLLGAHVGLVECSGATIRNDSGPVLYADGLQADQGLMLRQRFEAIGAGENGAVRLLLARVTGLVDCSQATIRNDSGPAIYADGLEAKGLLLREEFKAVGAGERGAVRVPIAHVGGILDCRRATIRNESGPALMADGLCVNGDAIFSNGFTAVGSGSRSVVCLPMVHIGGGLRLSLDGVENRSGDPRLLLDGLTYSGIPDGTSVDDWLNLFREKTEGTPRYVPQPYQQLATAYQAAGHDSQARKILMRQRRHQIDSKAVGGLAARAWARFTGWTLGYGYQPWRALIGLLAVLTAAVLLCVLTTGALEHTRNSKTPGTACTTLERIGVGLDLGVPLLKTGARAQCDVTATPAGQALTVSVWVLQVLAWAFATLFIAGFTSAVRKT